MKKLNIGKKTMSSVKFQVVSIIQTLHNAEALIESIEPIRFARGNYLLVSYYIINEPYTLNKRYFAHQKIRDFCDVWLESPTFHR